MNAHPMFRFRLYVADDTRNSAQAKANLTALCATYLPGQYEVEIVDVFKQPERALKDGVLMTPTLLKVVPAPAQRIVGTLDQTESVIVALGLEAIPCSKPSTA